MMRCFDLNNNNKKKSWSNVHLLNIPSMAWTYLCVFNFSVRRTILRIGIWSDLVWGFINKIVFFYQNTIWQHLAGSLCLRYKHTHTQKKRFSVVLPQLYCYRIHSHDFIALTSHEIIEDLKFIALECSIKIFHESKEPMDWWYWECMPLKIGR